MKRRLLLFASAVFAVTGDLRAGAMELQAKETAPPTITESEPWQFTIAVPGWMMSLNGTIGIRGVNADIDVGLDQILQHLDGIFAVRAEAQKGPFGIFGEFIYASLGAGADVNGLVKSVDVHIDQYYVDAGLTWRLVNQPRWSLDLGAGSHYFNLYQRMTLYSDTVAIQQASEQFINNISNGLRDRLNNDISNSEFLAALKGTIRADIANRIDNSLGGQQTKPKIPIGPLAGHIRQDIAQIVEGLIRTKERALRARIDALHLSGDARRAAVNLAVSAARGQISNQLASTLNTNLSQTLARGDYWFDPYLGLRTRYNFNKVFYTAVRGEIGGFGVGADLMWQVEGVVGINLTRNIFTEVGYRALSTDYENDGLVFDVIAHGPEITTGITF